MIVLPIAFSPSDLANVQDVTDPQTLLSKGTEFQRTNKKTTDPLHKLYRKSSCQWQFLARYPAVLALLVPYPSHLLLLIKFFKPFGSD
jgi:hypothetical protein